jgi:hypothetical protein
LLFRSRNWFRGSVVLFEEEEESSFVRLFLTKKRARLFFLNKRTKVKGEANEEESSFIPSGSFVAEVRSEAQEAFVLVAAIRSCPWVLTVDVSYSGSGLQLFIPQGATRSARSVGSLCRGVRPLEANEVSAYCFLYWILPVDVSYLRSSVGSSKKKMKQS